MNDLESRKKVLSEFGAGPSEIEELLTYNENHFDHSLLENSPTFPLEPEPHIEAWQRYYEESKNLGVEKVLKKYLPQFNFPIQKGISQTPAYIAATRRGQPIEEIPEATGLKINAPDKLQLLIHQSAAGPLPMLIIGDRGDFESILRALTAHNEPENVPPSMGACMIKGYINWDRIYDYKRKWQASEPLKNTEDAWGQEFQKIAAHKELYQDRFMLISTGPYSNTPASAFGLEEDNWREISANLRIHHESTHFFTLSVFQTMRNNMLDEIIADYMGIRGAIGSYKADWFLRFIGLENFPEYREGGRMQNYIGNMSPNSFKILQKIMVAAAKNLETFDAKMPQGPGSIPEQASILLALTSLTVEEMAAPDGVDRLLQAHQKYRVQGS
jgi:hypothetical protein